jgi:hypothetical protein
MMSKLLGGVIFGAGAALGLFLFQMVLSKPAWAATPAAGYEYKTLGISVAGEVNATQLNKAGADGWRFVGLLGQPGTQNVMVLERPR